MTEFNARQGPYRGWSQDKRDRIFGQLAALIDTLMLGSAVAIVAADYNALTKPQQARLASHYAILAAMTIGQVLKWLRDRQAVEQVQYIFEFGDPGAGRVVAVINDEIKPQYKDLGDSLLGASLEDKRRWPGLQAADILAFETCKYLPVARGVDPRAPRHSLARILKTVPTLKRWVDSAMLHVLLAKQTPEGHGFVPRARPQRERRRPDRRP